MPSTAVKDVYDNAENFDSAMNDLVNPVWVDRLGRSRKTYAEIERLADPGTALDAASRAEEAADRAAAYDNLLVYISYDSPSEKRMVDDTSQAVGTLGRVTNDADPAKNGDWVMTAAGWEWSDVQVANSKDVTRAQASADNAQITALTRQRGSAAPLVDPWDVVEDVTVDSAGRVVGGDDATEQILAKITTIGGGLNYAYILVTNGQSNSVGQVAGGAQELLYTDNPWPATLLKTNIGIHRGKRAQGEPIQRVDASTITGFEPLTSDLNTVPSQATSITEGAAYQFYRWLEISRGVAPVCVAVNLGWGGVSIDSLVEGQPLYIDGVAIVQRVADLLRAQGLTPIVAYVDWDHGESDMSDSNYDDQLIDLRDSFNAACVANTSQKTPIPWMVAQPSSFYRGALPPEDIGRAVQAIYRLCKSRPRDFILSGPSYHLPFSSDLLHRSSHSHGIKGEFNATALIRAHYLRMDSPVLLWDCIEYDGTTTLRLFPSLPVERDPNITDPGSWGFNVYDGAGAEVSISSVALSNGGAAVTLQLASTPVPGALRRVTYAINSQYIDTRDDPAKMPRGQLRATKPFGTAALDGSALYAYMPHSSESF
ncbi:hypothetical protein CAL20_09900 [Bordetella genomosp. 4]|uniref:Sialate O-acetylesterase domain-containing protein n=1 Tax=Bordetella genomosp. 4 TaxID=463044 RepID=A0A261U6X1_9BORD|nr:hypothetical protein CAL20_09900 [Bordetella genomosp. 4]